MVPLEDDEVGRPSPRERPEVLVETGEPRGDGRHHGDEVGGGDRVALPGELATRDLHLGEQARRAGRQPVGAERDGHPGRERLAGQRRLAVEAQVGLRRPHEPAAEPPRRSCRSSAVRARPVDDVRRRGRAAEVEEAAELLGAALVVSAPALGQVQVEGVDVAGGDAAS